MTNLFYNLLICLSFASFAFAFRSHLRKGTKDNKQVMEDFLRAEHEASFVTKKTFPSQLLITLDQEKIPDVKDEKCLIPYEKLIAFIDVPMVSLDGYTNLELKKTFGINHFSTLVRYEETLNAFTWQAYHYALTLEENNYPKEAFMMLSYLVDNQWTSERIMVAYKRLAMHTNY